MKLTEGFHMSRRAILIVVLVALWAIPGVAAQLAKDPQPTKESYRNTFVNGCVSGGGTNDICGCAYDELLVLYPDFNTNSDRMNRIVTEGYSQAETDAVLPCVNPQS